jgi:Tol biopolymer transport system component
MALTSGTRLGVYEITSAIGAGGMGEVYRARDTRLERDVAIKILPEPFAGDPERLARFDREAKTLAALNHPNIAIIHGVEEGPAAFDSARAGEAGHHVRALVMELVDGPTLADRIAQGPIPIDEALPIARQICEALEAAHEQGVIHRDLKPANIKVRADGTVKVLDFGLAKLAGPPDVGAGFSRPDATGSPTITSPALMTGAGVLLGTAAYMSPEQARGKAVDKRSDVWAFGCVLYEMLAGQRPFDGSDVTETIAAVVKDAPQWNRLPAATPASVRRLLRRCLTKDPHHRLAHIADARLELDDPEAAEATPLAGASRTRERLLWAAALLLMLAAAGSIAWRAIPVAPAELRLEVSSPGFGGYAISPDGRSIAYSAEGESGPQIWLRPLSPPVEPRAIPGTEGGNYPFWSPDGRSLGFFTSAWLKRVDVDGGNPATLAPAMTPAGGTWNSSGTILYVPNDNGGVISIPAAGGQPTVVTPGTLATRRPEFLPDGRHFLFYVARGDQPAGVYVGELGNPSVRRVMAADGPALYGAGHLWFVRERTLLVQPFDLDAHSVNGAATTISDDVPVTLFEAPIAVSTAGLIGYRRGTGELTSRQLVWFDRAGNPVGTIPDPDGSLVSNPEISPDGERLAVQRTVRQNVDIWTVNLRRDPSFIRMTDAPGIDSFSVWSPDGARVLHTSVGGAQTGDVGPDSQALDLRPGMFAIRWVDGRRPEERVDFRTPGIRIGCDWSPDGKYLLVKTFDVSVGEQSTGSDLVAWPMDGEKEPVVVARSRFEERDGQFWPVDGTWIAYESDESGRPEIYVQPFPGPGGKIKVSVGGGRQGRWRRDGRELFYIAPNGTLMSVPVAGGALPGGLGSPAPLFKTRLAPFRTISRQQYVVSRDGQRFLMVAREGEPQPITLILNWRPPSPQ